MKLIKLIIVGLVTLTMVFAQENQQGEDGDHDGGPSFEDVDTNGDGVIDREEARAFFGDEPEFDAEYDRISGDDGVIDHAEFMAEDDGGGPGTCDVCGHEYGGEDDHHGHCRVCDAEMNTDDDWRVHCDENWEHCKAQAGDVCGFRGHDGQGEECGYVHTGDPEEDHHHCDTCGMAVNSGDEMGAHCNDNPDHCGGGDHGGGPSFEDVDTNGDGVIDREEARAAFGDEPEFDAEYDRISGDDGVIDHAEFMAEDDGDHEGEFYCGECDASFVSEGEMNEHMQREHGEGAAG